MRIFFNIVSVLLTIGGLLGLVDDGGMVAVAVLAIGMIGVAIGMMTRGA